MMDILSVLASIILYVLWIVWSILWWILSFFLMPLLLLVIIAALALRYAYRTPKTKPYVEAFLNRVSQRSRAWGMSWVKRLIYSLTVLPIRVILRFIGFSIWHAWINLWWKPKWTPWQRAIQPPKERKEA